MKESPLKQVGYINIGSDMNFYEGNNDVDILSFS